MAVGRTTGGDFEPSAPLNSFVDTVRRVVTQPTSFFRGLPRQGNFANPLIFALICFVINAILTGLLELAGVGASRWFVRVADGRNIFERVIDFLGTLVFTPIAGVIGIFIGAAILQLLTRLIVGANNSGYRASFRVASYTAVTALVNWIPVIGGLLALYGIYLSVVGIREMHQTTTGKAALVVLIPVGVVVLLGLVVLLIVGISLMGGR